MSMILLVLEAIGETILVGLMSVAALAYMVGVILGGAIVACVVIEKIF